MCDAWTHDKIFGDGEHMHGRMSECCWRPLKVCRVECNWSECVWCEDAGTWCITVSFEGLKEMRGSYVHILELFCIIWFWGEALLYLGQFSTVFLLLEARLQCIIVSLEGPEKKRGACVLIPDIFHIIWFGDGYAVPWSVLHHFLSLKARLQCIPI